MLPAKVKSSFKPPSFVSQSSQNASSGSLPAANVAVVNVKLEGDPSTVKSKKTPLVEIGNKSAAASKEKAAKSGGVKARKDGNKENSAPNGFAVAPKKDQKKLSVDGSAHIRKPVENRPRERKPKEAPKPFSVMSDAEYDEMFSSVIAANACDTASECSDVGRQTEAQAVPPKKARVARAARPKMKVSQLNEAAYDDIFSSAIGRSDCESETPMDVEVSEGATKKGRRSAPDVSELCADSDAESERDADAPMDFGSADEGDENQATPPAEVITPPNVFQPRVEMRRPVPRAVSKTPGDDNSSSVRRKLMFEGEGEGEGGDDALTPLPCLDDVDEQLMQGQSCFNAPVLDQSSIVSSTQKSAASTSQGSTSSTGGHFKLPLVHRTQGKSGSSKGFKPPTSLGKLKAAPTSKAAQIPPSKKARTSQAQSSSQSSATRQLSASQSSQRSDVSLSQSQTLSQVDYHVSQPPEHLSARERLEWLQERRDVGVWVLCDSCNKNRFLPDCKDPLELPDEWYCRLHPDPVYNSCETPEVGPTLVEQEDIIHNIYTSGSVVWARLDGFPWWPAMVDDCPDVEDFYWLNGFSDIPTHYNVTFFDKEPTRAWLMPSQLQPYTGREKGRMFKSAAYGESYAARLAVAKSQANEALALTPAERRKRFSFVARYKGAIGPHRRVSLARVRKELAKLEKSSLPRLSQREMSLVRQLTDVDSTSESEREDSSSGPDSDDSDSEDEGRKHKGTQKKAKGKKRPSTKQKDSVVFKKPRVDTASKEKSLKNMKKKAEKRSLKRDKAAGSKKKRAACNRERSASETSDVEEDSPEMPALEREGSSSVVAKRVDVALRDVAANVEKVFESLDEETFYSPAERARNSSVRAEGNREKTVVAEENCEQAQSEAQNDEQSESEAENDEQSESEAENDKAQLEAANNAEVQSDSESDAGFQSDTDNDEQAESEAENDEQAHLEVKNDKQAQSGVENDVEVLSDSENDEQAQSEAENDAGIQSDSENDEQAQSEAENDAGIQSDSENDEHAQSEVKNDKQARSETKNDAEVQSDSENDEQAQSEAEKETDAQSDSDNEKQAQSDAESNEKSDGDLMGSGSQALRESSPFSDRSNSPSLLSTQGTPDVSQSLSVTDEDRSQCVMSGVVTTSSSQRQHDERSTNAADNNWLARLSENAVVPNGDSQTDLDFSQDFYDATVPEVGSSSALSEPYSSEADAV